MAEGANHAVPDGVLASFDPPIDLAERCFDEFKRGRCVVAIGIGCFERFSRSDIAIGRGQKAKLPPLIGLQKLLLNFGAPVQHFGAEAPTLVKVSTCDLKRTPRAFHFFASRDTERELTRFYRAKILSCRRQIVSRFVPAHDCGIAGTFGGAQHAIALRAPGQLRKPRLRESELLPCGVVNGLHVCDALLDGLKFLLSLGERSGEKFGWFSSSSH
jgi:hypothetical protein